MTPADRAAPTAGPLPYKRLASFYFFWFAALGALLPYWGLYLQERGVSAAGIGLVFAVLLGTKMVAPNVWGLIVDRYGGRMAVIRGAAVAAALAFVCLPLTNGFALLLVLTAVYGFFANASLPQFEAVTFSHLGQRTRDYGRVRLWGSVGFIVSVGALGLVLQLSAGGLWLVPWWAVGCLALLVIASLTVPDAPNGGTDEAGAGLLRVLREPRVVSLLAVCFLAQFSHGPYYSFFSIYMAGHGYGRALIGGLWALGVAAEVVVFACLPWLVGGFGLRRLMLAAMALTTLRWCLLAAFPELLSMVLFVQCLHLASFGIYHAVAVSLIHDLFRGRLQGRGQALYSSLSFGAGGAAGALASGALWAVAPHYSIYLMAAVAAAMAWAIAWVGLREPAVA